MSTAVETAPTQAAPTVQPGPLTKDTYKGKIHPDWCPGCGDFSVLSALQTALFELGLKPHQVLVVSGIGCSSNLPGFINLSAPIANGGAQKYGSGFLPAIYQGTPIGQM